MYIYRVFNKETNEVADNGPIFDSDKAIEHAKSLKAKHKGEYKVCSIVPIFSTEDEQEKQKDIDF